MTLVALSKSRGYRLVHEDQDWHGWPVQDAGGHALGRVTDFIIDTEEERAVSLVLDTAARIPVDAVRVRDGHLLVPGGAAAVQDAARLPAFEEGTLEVMERAEIAVMTKRPRVIEELVISRDIVERRERIHSTVRQLDVDVEEITEQRGSTTGDNDGGRST